MLTTSCFRSIVTRPGTLPPRHVHELLLRAILDEGIRFPKWLATRLGLGGVGYRLGRALEAVVGELRVGEDLLGNDPMMFYDVIQRRRNWANASFCCGAGGVHRREAVMEAALKAYATQVQQSVQRFGEEVEDPDLREVLTGAMIGGSGARHRRPIPS